MRVIEFCTKDGLVAVPAENVSHIFCGKDGFGDHVAIVYIKGSHGYYLHPDESPKDVIELLGNCGVEQQTARLAHNQEVAGLTPASATILIFDYE